MLSSASFDPAFGFLGVKNANTSQPLIIVRSLFNFNCRVWLRKVKVMKGSKAGGERWTHISRPGDLQRRRRRRRPSPRLWFRLSWFSCVMSLVGLVGLELPPVYSTQLYVHAAAAAAGSLSRRARRHCVTLASGWLTWVVGVWGD